MPKISAIICTYNRSDYLPKAISSLIDQTIPEEYYETLIIDNCSTDNTRQIVEDFQLKHGNIRYFYEGVQGLSAARNRGIKEAKGKLIAYLDDDAIACNEWLEEYIKVFKEYPNAGCAGGRIDLIWPDGKKPYWMMEQFEAYYGRLNKGDEIKLLIYPEIPFGGNLCIKKELLDIVGNFDEKLGRKKDSLLSNEEFDLVERVRKYKDVLYIPKAHVAHHVLPNRINKKYLQNRYYWQGKSDVKCEINMHRFQKRIICKNIISLIKNSPFRFLTKESHFIRLVKFQYNKGRIVQTIKEIPRNWFCVFLMFVYK